MKQSEIALTLLDRAAGAVPLEALRAAGVSPETLRRMLSNGTIERPASGHYALPGRIDVMDLDWVAFSLQVPEGVLGLLTAATHHGITQELPVHLHAFVPRTRSGHFRLGGDSGASVDVVMSRHDRYLTIGVEEVVKSGHTVRLTTKERTLVDLFLFSPFNSRTTDRSVRIPEETFLESLSRCVEDDTFSFEVFHEIAETFGCDDQITPYTKTSRYDFPRGPRM